MKHALIRPFLCALLLAGALFSAPSYAEDLDVPILQRADGDLDTCALGQVTGLKADGDGFLAVRTGPGTDFRKIDEIHNGDRVWIFEFRNDWYGVLYDVQEVECGPVPSTRFLPENGRKGWIHSNWVTVIAG